ncbi:hypothetical protein ACN9M1_18985 [Ralstonia sp. R-29]|uniref:hypothetical protein n=1 Tax=Ralstonia sp. R-29 TaxID=3404059 RepID=UPI003CF26584
MTVKGSYPGNPRQLLADVVTDSISYRKLAQLLEDQFAAAMRLDTQALAALAKSIAVESDAINLRRRYRVERIGHAPGAVLAFGQRLLSGDKHAAQRASFVERCTDLKAQAARCQALTARNGGLLAAQYEAMQRLMHGERHIYAPA